MDPRSLSPKGTLGSRCPGDGGEVNNDLWKTGHLSVTESRPSQAFPAVVGGPGLGRGRGAVKLKGAAEALPPPTP